MANTDIRMNDLIFDCTNWPGFSSGMEGLLYNLELLDKVDESRLLCCLSLYGSQPYIKTGLSVRYFTDKYEPQVYF